MLKNLDIQDLFDPLRYPEDPGYQKTETSYEAAKKIRPAKHYYENRVIDMLKQYVELTDHEIASKAGEDFDNMQPARSRLTQRGLIEACGRGFSAKGNPCNVWKLT